VRPVASWGDGGESPQPQGAAHKPNPATTTRRHAHQRIPTPTPDRPNRQNIGAMIKRHFPESQFIVVSLKEGMFNNANVLFRTKFIDGVSTVGRYEGGAVAPGGGGWVAKGMRGENGGKGRAAGGRGRAALREANVA